MSNLDGLLDEAGASVYIDDDLDAVNALVLERGWGDGLPVELTPFTPGAAHSDPSTKPADNR